MSRKSVALGLGIMLVLVGGTASLLFLLVRQEPRVFEEHSLPPGDERIKRSHEFIAECALLVNGIANKRQWFAQFSDEQINSYFEEDFVRADPNRKILPEGISEPRIAIEPDKVRLAFRYGTEKWNTMISIELRVWLASREPNVVVMELQGFRAGSLPISAQSLLDRIADAAKAHNVELTWYRHNGNPVALVRLQPYQTRPTFQLQRLELVQGEMRIYGRSTDPVPAPAPSSEPGVTTARIPSD